ncbi:hypothetical protein EsH8_I_000419 [Colletotrichum jinshuiense]
MSTTSNPVLPPPDAAPARQYHPPVSAEILRLVFPRPTSLAPLAILALALASPAPNWTCTTTSPPGPGLAGLRTIHNVFAALYGEAPLTLRPEQARVATCGGLLFGLWNGHARPVAEKPGRREAAAAQGPGDEGTECLAPADDDDDLDDDLRLSYMFGFGEDSWVSGGLTEVRRCED